MSTKNQSYGALPMSQNSFLYKAMKKMTAYEIAMQDQWLKQIMAQAEVVGGLTRDSEGNISVALDSDGNPTYGTTGNFITLSTQAAISSGDVYRDDAKNSLIQAGVGAGGLTANLGSHFLTNNSELTSQMKQAKSLQSQLNNGAASGNLRYGNAPGSAYDLKVDGIVNKMANGQKEAFTNWGKDANGQPAAPGSEDEQAYKDAIQQAKGPQHAAIAKNLEEHIADLERQIQKNVTSFNSYSNTITQVTNVANGAGSAAFNFQKADDQQEAQTVAAKADVQKNSVQQQNGFINDSKTKADEFFREAGQIASGYGQIVNTHA